MAVLLLGSATVAAAAPAPSVASSSDLSEGVSVAMTDASENKTKQLVIATDNSTSIASADVTIEHANRNTTHYTATDTSSEYSYSADALDTDGNGNVDSDSHTWNITHDEFADVPMGVNEAVNLTVTAEFENSAGETGNTTFTFELSNSDERSVMNVDSSSIDDDTVGADATSETEDLNVFEAFLSDSDSDTETTYTVEDHRELNATNGNSTTVYLHLSDSDLASEYEAAAEGAESGDLILTQTNLADGHIAHTFLNSRNSDVADANDTYAIYHKSDNMVEINVGDDYSDRKEVGIFSASHPPDELESIGIDELSAAFADHASREELTDAFGFKGLRVAWGLSAVWGGMLLIGLRREDV